MSLRISSSLLRIVGWSALLILPYGCGTNSADHQNPEDSSATAESSLEWLAFRFRQDFSAGLNADSGWAAAENAMAELTYDQPFRFRAQVRANTSVPEGHLLSLQYRWQGGSWLPAGVSDFPYPAFATPVISIVSTQAYEHGDETERLLGQPDMDWDDGAGLNLVASTPVWRTTNDALEWEWPLVVRRFSDGPTFAENDSVFELRVVDGSGHPIAGQQVAQMRVSALPGHLGGTFIETPGRLGPYQTEEGHLYFFMEPTETDNRFMTVKSTDFGKSWREVDGSNRPQADDLEGVATTRSGSTIHVIHQVTREVFYHAFDMGSSASEPGSWIVDSESIAKPEEPPTQFASVEARSDGSLVTFYGGSHRLFLQTRSPQGVWGDPVEIDTDVAPDLSGPMMAIGDNDVITLAYTGFDGSGFIRHLDTDGTLSPRQLISSNLGTRDPENGAIAPLVSLPETGTTVVVYREHDGLLHERRFTAQGELSDPVQISQIAVVTDAVDSEQVGADLISHGDTLYLLFIDEQSRSIFHSRSSREGIWSEPQVLVEGIEGAWLRGSVHLDAAGNPVYGFVFDGGSRGGAGFNRYFALPL